MRFALSRLRHLRDRLEYGNDKLLSNHPVSIL